MGEEKIKTSTKSTHTLHTAPAPTTKILERKGSPQQTNKFFPLFSARTDFWKILPNQKWNDQKFLSFDSVLARGFLPPSISLRLWIPSKLRRFLVIYTILRKIAFSQIRTILRKIADSRSLTRISVAFLAIH